MNDLRDKNSMNELSMVDLFDTIDNVGKNNDDNDKIISQIREQVICIFSSKLRKKREKQRKEAMLHRYKAYVESLQTLLKEQMKMIDNLLEDDDNDIADKFLTLKKELLEYSTQAYELDLQDMSEVLNRKEQTVYQYVNFYDLIDNYSSASKRFFAIKEEDQNSKRKCYNRQENALILSRWKTYYYLTISLEKQRDYNEKFITYYLKKNSQEQDEKFLPKLSDYYAADFQGQFSKNIYCQRKRLKLTQKQLQDKSGVNRTMIAKIEKVQQPTTLDTAIKLLSSLNLGITIYPLSEYSGNSLKG
ncbi:helix-turn-helix domain-containing protein [Coprococcus sp. RTP21428st1_C9_RTP21428_210409]|jgi:DNA-binding XRE family transcriptional regulator|uniref:helix-turn-helix domain-containing protein n=1 Tax=unclassified Coprococcus TaxID=2684943 RepID=UPI002EA5C855|nr:helix-turn-helix domain-containing protein [Coprococcus sp.]